MNGGIGILQPCRVIMLSAEFSDLELLAELRLSAGLLGRYTRALLAVPPRLQTRYPVRFKTGVYRRRGARLFRPARHWHKIGIE
jgi:hypothetical protein